MLSFGKEYNSVKPLNSIVKGDLHKKTLKKLSFEDEHKLPSIKSVSIIRKEISTSSGNLKIARLESQTFSSENS